MRRLPWPEITLAVVAVLIAALYVSLVAALGWATAGYFGAERWYTGELRDAIASLPLVRTWPVLIPLTFGVLIAVTLTLTVVPFFVSRAPASLSPDQTVAYKDVTVSLKNLPNLPKDVFYELGTTTRDQWRAKPTGSSNSKARPSPAAPMSIAPSYSPPVAKYNPPPPPRPEPPSYTDDRQINAWIDGHDPKQPLVTDTSYPLSFQVSLARPDVVQTEGDLKIPAGAIPAGGLPTDWIVTSTAVDFMSGSDGVRLSTQQRGDASVAVAEFSLRIPAAGASANIVITIKPRVASVARLDVQVCASGEMYRSFSVRLDARPPSPTRKPLPAVKLGRDTVLAPLGQIGLRPKGEWHTPPGRLTMFVQSLTQMFAQGLVNGTPIGNAFEWNGTPASVAGPLDQLQDAADKLREAHQSYFDHIPDAALLAALRSFQPTYDWSYPVEPIPAASAAAWTTVESSPELSTVAYYGYQVYDSLFPSGTPLRALLDGAPRGQRLDITWLQNAAANGWIPNLPWALMYQLPVQPGDAVDATRFLGLRFRIDYATHGTRLKSRSLGNLNDAYRGIALYWGDQPGDETTAAAQWQQAALPQYANHVFVPDGKPGAAKAKLSRLISKPQPSPMTLLYLFCQTDSTSPPAIQLRFGSGKQAGDLLSMPEMGSTPFADPPLVFLNACTSSGGSPYRANGFQQLFTQQRGCGAYVGSEIKVPIQFASRFSIAFFFFLYREVDPQRQPIAAGEAFAQARLFMWTHFRNVGGLFYNYVNEYDLFLASEQELAQMRTQ